MVERSTASVSEEIAGMREKIDAWGRTKRSAKTAEQISALDDRVGEERRAVHRLWNACVEAINRAGDASVPARATPVR